MLAVSASVSIMVAPSHNFLMRTGTALLLIRLIWCWLLDLVARCFTAAVIVVVAGEINWCCYSISHELPHQCHRDVTENMQNKLRARSASDWNNYVDRRRSSDGSCMSASAFQSSLYSYGAAVKLIILTHHGVVKFCSILMSWYWLTIVAYLDYYLYHLPIIISSFSGRAYLGR